MAMTARPGSSRLLFTAAGAAFAVGVGVLVLPGASVAPDSTRQRPVASTQSGTGAPTSIAGTQQHLRDVPGDWQAWAGLALDYVEQAKISADPTYYPKAAAALRTSLRLERQDNYLAMAGMGALAAARHDFRSALRWSTLGLAVNPRSALLYGVRTDALTQLGRYDAAERAARRMELLRPGTDAEARLSYAAELRGDVATARYLMRQAREHAVDPAQRAFAEYYLGELDLSSGRPRAALRHYAAGLRADQQYVANVEGRAKALAALGRANAALQSFAEAVSRVPQPSYVLAYGNLLASLGRTAQARRQFEVFRAEVQLLQANGVALDTDQTLFEADHGDPDRAVALARDALRARPFLDSYDAYAWALHRAGRDRAALVAVDRALSTGVHNILFEQHRREIVRALQGSSR
jgi:tetratricopeptide (TPR) repeat protein